MSLHTKLPRIFLFGATGRVGQVLAEKIDDSGYPLVCVGRNTEILHVLPGEHEVFDLKNKTNNTLSIQDGDVVINAAHASYTSSIIKMCPENVEKLIVIGSAMYLSRFPEIMADRVRAAAQVLENSKLNWVLLHPTMIYGAGGDNNVRRMAALIRRFHFIPLPGAGKALIQPIHVQDVAEAVVRAISKPNLHRKVIHLAGPAATSYCNFLHAIADASGSWVKVVPLPVSLLRLVGSLARVLPGVPVVSDAEIVRLQEDKSVDTVEMEELLGLVSRPLDQGLVETFGG